MFYQKQDGYLYSSPIADPQGTNAIFPIEIDTEYTHPPIDFNKARTDICVNLTVNQRALIHEKGRDYDLTQNPCPRRFNEVKYGFTPIDYLKDYGYDVELTRPLKIDNATDLPWIQFNLIAFFALAEILRVVDGVYKQALIDLMVHPNSQAIEQGRRLRTSTKVAGQYLEYIELPWLLKMNGYEYRVRISVIDTCALQGMASYATLAANTGVILPYKDSINAVEKREIYYVYMEPTERYQKYTGNDTYNQKILENHAENMKLVYKVLGVEKYYKCPKLTIGATIARLFGATIQNLFGVDKDDNSPIKGLCKFSSADYLKRINSTNAWLNAKVDGGRCRNNRPLESNIFALLCDLDINSAYGEGLRVQTYPLGVPVMIDYPMHSPNKYLTLRQFLRKYKRQLVPGGWQARATLKPGYQLTNQQDLFPSWYPPKNDAFNMPSDTEFAETDQWWEVENVGLSKIFTTELNRILLQHDNLQWIDNTAGKLLRTELYDNLLIETAMFYPLCEKVNSVDELLDIHSKHCGKNTVEVKSRKRRTRKISISQECHAWYGVNIGDLLIDKLLIERGKYLDKSPLNSLYKLCVNTVYGDMVSPFFSIGNVVVGNNITARVRVMAWCMEKGFNGFQTITDGCALDINRVLYSRGDRKINGSMVVNLHADKKKMHHTFKPLPYLDDLSVTVKSYEFIGDNNTDLKLKVNCEDDNRKIIIDNPTAWIKKSALSHLRDLFPGLDVLHAPSTDLDGNPRVGQFEFKPKGFFDRGVFHGSANYWLRFGDDDSEPAMRSYSKRDCEMVIPDDDDPDELILSEIDQRPTRNFLSQLFTNQPLQRSPVYIKSKILKVGDYRKNYSHWKITRAEPGMSVNSASLLHEFNLNQFTFQTHAQYKSWERELKTLTRKYNQTYEMFFLNDDGTLNYQQMIVDVEGKIRNGRANFFDGVDKRQAHMYREYLKHRETFNLERAEAMLEHHYLDNGEEIIAFIPKLDGVTV
jgi:hypothetical protein